MGFESGPISFRRYAISGWSAQSLNEDRFERLRALTHGAVNEVTDDATEVGWVAPTHLFDTEIDLEKISFGRFVHLVLRIDRLEAPPAVVRSYQRMEEAAALEASGQQHLTTRQRREAKESARARAQQEAQAGTFRRITAHPLVIDRDAGVVYFSSLGHTPHEKLVSLFAKTFDAHLTPLDAGELATRGAGEHGLTRFLDDIEPVHLIDSPVGESGVELPEPDRAYLGREFLTWLWHALDTGDGTIALMPDGRTVLPSEVSVMFSKSMQLDCDFFATGRTSIHTDGPTLAPEAKVAIGIGKQPTKVGLILAGASEQFTLGFDARRFCVTGLRLPDVEEISRGGRLEERCRLMVRCASILDALYARFLKERLGGKYATKLGELRLWARTNVGTPSAEQAFRIAR